MSIPSYVVIIKFVRFAAVSTFLINTIVQGALLWLGTRLIEENNLSPAVLLAFMLYQSQLQNETLSLMNSYTSLIKSSGAGDKVFVLLDRIPPAPSTANALAEAAVVNHSTTEPQLDSTIESGDLERHTEPEFLDITESQYAISFENVSFAYPSRPENSVLTGLNLEIPRGQTVAVVGRSGCGKTTIVNLLQRFYDPISGRVLINGEDLRTLDIWKHRRRIGVVTQDPALFGGTLRENILYGSFARTGALLADQSGNPMVAASNVNLDNDRVVRAAQLAHADVFIRTFPDGYETSIGDRGVQLSGGQKQRIGERNGKDTIFC